MKLDLTKAKVRRQLNAVLQQSVAAWKRENNYCWPIACNNFSLEHKGTWAATGQAGALFLKPFVYQKRP